MAVPKKRTTRSAQGQRRSHDALKPVGLAVCPACGKDVVPHSICESCGQYRGRKLLKV